MGDIILSESHRRAISAAIYMVGKNISEIDNEIRKYGHNTNSGLSSNELKHYTDSIGAITEAVRQLAGKYDLKLDDCALLQKITASKIMMWEILCETKAEKLEQYGALPKNAACEIDFDIANLMELIEQI